ncbi:Crp/Fnr family transcriptional regulator [Niabella hibiscisoli]|uniref:Crp/Fnr family transcriptional regulator n=1 Tax=Niabella hibiscisoli TaxID=1825928 RepID=UPI001F0E629B|nr:cyclic nucleotide-binding domain-containing protein [Niabella hibiscisoli]MCH5720852.1 cyclic nucleotide-binding domain-containing protein [Niabella hibiscisoli]
MEQLIQHLKSYYPLSAEASQALGSCLEEKCFAKNDYLIKAGRVCRYFYFMETGALRGFYHLNGKEITHWFGFENTFITSFHSYITEQPAVENIQFMEGSIMWAISKKTSPAYLINTMNSSAWYVLLFMKTTIYDWRNAM